MDIFLLWALILLAAVFIAYLAWKLIKYAYNLSHRIAKRIYSACNGVVIEKEKTVSSTDIPKQLNKVEIILSDTEQRIRSDWLRSLFTYVLGVLVIPLGSFFIVYLGNEATVNEIVMENLSSVIFLAIFLAVFTTIMFFFAYVKFGTKWIGGFLFMSPIGTIFEGIKDFAELFKLPDITMFGISFMLILYLFPTSLYIYFWIHCRRLYKLNSAIKKRKIENVDRELEPIQVV